MTDADTPAGGVGIVIVAGGSGTRLGAEVPKAFARLAGRTLLSYAVERVARVGGLRSVVLVLPDGWLPDGAAFDHEVSRHLPPGTCFVVGGAERSDSVRAGIERIDRGCDVVLVHDAARCLTPTSLFDAVVAGVRSGRDHGWGGVVPGLAVVDTIKTVDARGLIVDTPERASLRAVQTPQGFDADVLRTAYASGLTATDDAALVEAAGHHVRVIEGDPLAFKITTPADLARAELLVT